MRRALQMIALSLAAAILAWLFLPLVTILWDGSFDLTVRVSSTAGPLQSVRCHACGHREDAEYILEYLRPETGLWSAVSDPFEGQPLTVIVPVSGRELVPLSGLELPWGGHRRFQYQYLVVIGQLKDGRRIGKLVEIPDGRVSREIDVSLP